MPFLPRFKCWVIPNKFFSERRLPVNGTIPFLEKFSKYSPIGEHREILSEASLVRFRADGENRLLEAFVAFPHIVDKAVLYEIERELGEAYQLRSVRLFPQYPAECFTEAYLPQAILELQRVGSVSRGFFEHYRTKLEGNRITIEIGFSGGGIELLYRADTHEALQKILQSEFGLSFEVTIRQEAGYAFDYADYEQAQKKALLDIAADAFTSSTVEVNEPPQPELRRVISLMGDGMTSAEVRPDGTVKVGNLTFDVSSPEPLYGQSFDIDPAPLRNLTMPIRRVCVIGLAYAIESKETRKGDKTILNFAITDDDASIYCKAILPTEEVKPLLGIKAGTAVAVLGSVRTDKFDNELAITPTAVMKIKQVKRMDNAPEKRVELHLHTQMSAMDGLIPPDVAVKTAYEWGHRAVAITDHGNVQGYQEAMLVADKTGMKVLYGLEAYFVDDTARAVYGNADASFAESEFVVFDIETTGLSFQNDRITEIGAVTVKGGEVLSVFNTFVDPGCPIPEHITALTGITDEMVKGAPSQEEAVRAFLHYAGDRVLIAHNAGFDTSFIRKVADDHGIPFPHTYLDTVALSRYVNPELNKHKLDTLAEYFKLGGFNHHRASDDAEMLAMIFFKMADKLSEEGLKTLSAMTSAMSDKVDCLKLKTNHMIILVKNKAGLKNLYKLVSFSYLNYFKKHPRIPKTVLDNYREGLIIGSACSEGQLFNAMLENRPHADLLEIASYYDYIEIQPIGNNRYLIDKGQAASDEDLREFNRRLIAIADELGKPVVATCDAHFLDKHDEIYRKILLKGMKFADGDKDTGIYFRTTEEMLEEFAYLGEEKAREVVITNPNKIADMIESDIRPFPKGTFTPHMEGAEEDLQRICYENAEKKYGKPIPEIVKNRLDKELTSIIKNGFAVLYMIAQKLVWYSESQGYLVGSRGSVGSSFVASMAGISEVNPLPPHYYCPGCQYSDFSNPDKAGSGFDLPDCNCPKCGTKMVGDGHDIPFETFLGFHGDKSPDIDLNFSGEVQGKVHKYTEELFGAENVFRAGTIGGLADKTVYGYVMKYLEEKGISLNKAEVQRLVEHCVGVKRTTGQHPGGIVVVPREYEIYDFCPVQHPADDPNSDIVTTHFTFSYLHDTLLKLDELGHDIPTKYKWLEKYSGTSVMDVPMNDPEVYELFASTRSLGISPDQIEANLGTYGLPEFGTRFVMKMVEEAKPKSFADLLQISGLSHGTDVWTGNAQELIHQGICDISHVIGCRDNIMNDLIRYGVDNALSFKIMESVRKGKGLTPEWEEEMKKHDVPDWYIGSCKKIKYMFPKAHAAAYVMSAIRLGWYKVHMPLVFYAAFFTAAPGGFDAEIAMSGKSGVVRVMKEIAEKGNEATQKELSMVSTLNLVNECYARGIRFLPVNFFKSDAFAYVPENGKIRLPFNSLAGVGENAAKAIAEARDSGEVLSVEELRLKAKLTKATVEILQKNGALEGLSETNQITFF
ncbi:MAG: PolC-type DNA polymerase III [Ruminococcaceae bacterium]|nr:PolC-type DNA polymerase III [Oscillospiraceae bacterium]